MEVRKLSVPEKLAFAIDSAGEKSNVDFDYLLQTAMRESSLNPKAKAPTSSATGLFQFIDSTWLQVMKEQGPRLGYGKYAEAIQPGRDGGYHVADNGLRAEILKLREDPQISADLAAAFTRSNGAHLKAEFGRMPSAGELYIAHFMGAQGATQFFRAGLDDPNQIAAKLFPRQARANPSIFYEDGKARTIRDVYKALVAKHDQLTAGAVDASFAVQQLATTPQADANGKWPDAEPVASRFGPENMSFTSMFTTEVAPASDVQPRVLIDPEDKAIGAALFTQLYGQPGGNGG
ncbi:transglycosylase SLT domain-containing protein [Devosia sp.]|uniref:transglycosylase SLT domain-containing protein n=1 Tax=Devosia sp. TaxID=1871048 RepID=UPI003A90212C